MLFLAVRRVVVPDKRGSVGFMDVVCPAVALSAQRVALQAHLSANRHQAIPLRLLAQQNNVAVHAQLLLPAARHVDRHR